jgi:alkylation response protein AidB-like acyl-CoA dehydrogenase
LIIQAAVPHHLGRPPPRHLLTVRQAGAVALQLRRFDAMSDAFGATDVPYAEPYWYLEDRYSPYYTESHVQFRAKVRAFVDSQIKPHVVEWETAEKLPVETLFRAAAAAGIYAPQWPIELGGTPPDGVDGSFDPFHGAYSCMHHPH